MIESMFQSGALPTLERLVQFTEQRHQVLTHDIANLSTPFFKPVDLDPKQFQQSLAAAVDQRRSGTKTANGPMELRDTDQLKFKDDGTIEVQSQETNDGILFHDQNNRDLERLMQHLAENTMTHNMGIELIRGELATLRTAIRGTL